MRDNATHHNIHHSSLYFFRGHPLCKCASSCFSLFVRFISKIPWWAYDAWSFLTLLLSSGRRRKRQGRGGCASPPRQRESLTTWNSRRGYFVLRSGERERQLRWRRSSTWNSSFSLLGSTPCSRWPHIPETRGRDQRRVGYQRRGCTQ